MSSEDVKKTRTGKFSKAFGFVFDVFALLFITIVLSVIIEWLGIAFDWWDLDKHYHAKSMFDSEINWVLGDFLSDNTFYKENFIHLFENAYYLAVQQTGLEWLSNNSDYLVQYILSAIYIIQVVVVRLIVILCAIPAFIMLNVFFVIDGLFIRQLRKISGATESAYIYHHAKVWIKPLIGLPIVLLLSSPWSVHPSIFILFVSIVPGFFIWSSVAYFKKYL
jgi:integrating conjugative element membrane protein (TIGR03747 family)